MKLLWDPNANQERFEGTVLPTLLEVNREHVPDVGEIGLEQLARFAEIARRFSWVEEEQDPVAFCIALDRDADYDSPNFLWFRERRESFLYVDRIAVAERATGRRFGRKLYEDLFEYARAHRFPSVTCEVNLEPRNERSLRFHETLGFVPVGEAHAKGHLVAYLERSID